MSTDRELIKDSLLTVLNQAKIVSGGAELAARCPFCGDSLSDKNKLSFYVNLKEDEPFFFTCFRASCGARGMLTSDTLRIFGIYDIDTNVALAKDNIKVLALPKNRKFGNKHVYRLNNFFDPASPLIEKKLNYINNRLGTALNPEDMLRLKIAPNLVDLLRHNNIQELTRDPRIVKALNEHSVGFISQDNAFLNMRMVDGEGKVHKSIDKRYNIYNIFGALDNTNRMYTIPTSINLNDPRPKKIHISEGGFDILSAYLNLRGPEPNSIFTAVGRSGFIGVIKHFIIVMKLMNL